MQKKFIINIFIYIIALKLKSRIINISGLVCCETRLTLFFYPYPSSILYEEN